MQLLVNIFSAQRCKQMKDASDDLICLF